MNLICQLAGILIELLINRLIDRSIDKLIVIKRFIE